MQTFAVEVLQTGGSVVIALQGELDVAGVPELLEALAPISRRYRPDQVTLDCRDLTFMDAAGLGAIVRSLLEQHQGEAKPILRGVNQVVMTILRVTGAAALFDVEALGEAVRHGEPFDIDDADA